MQFTPRDLICTALVAATAFMAVPSQAYEQANPCAYCSQPTLTPGNGGAQHPEVVLIFWQDSPAQQWSANSTTPTMSHYIGYVKQLLNSAYTTGLQQYAGGGGYIARPRFSGFAPTYTGASPLGNTSAHYGMDDAVAIINSEINQGLVPPPIQYTYNGTTVTDDVIYAVIAPTTHWEETGGCALGDACNARVQDDNGRFYEAILADELYEDFSHELVEAITWWQGVKINNNCIPGGGLEQIADYCTCSVNGGNPGVGSLDGMQYAQSYYSAADGACVIPEAWGDLLYDTQQGGAWTDFVGPMSQLYGGAGGVVTVDQAENMYYVSPSRAFPQGNAGFTGVAEMAAGYETIVWLPMDTAQALQYTGVGNPNWLTLPGLPTYPCDANAFCPYPVPVTQVTMTTAAGGTMFALNPTGEVYGFWLGVWNDLYARCDQIIPHNHDLLCLNRATRQVVWDFPASEVGTSEHTWYQVASLGVPAVQLVTSSDNAVGLWGFVQAGEKTMWGSNAGSFTGTEFASFSLSSGVWQGGFEQQGSLEENWYNTSAKYWSHWYDSGPVGRLVSGGDIYATSCSGLTATCTSY